MDWTKVAKYINPSTVKLIYLSILLAVTLILGAVRTLAGGEASVTGGTVDPYENSLM